MLRTEIPDYAPILTCVLTKMAAGGGSVNIQNTDENVLEIMTLSPEDIVKQWASENQISEDAVGRLFEEGFTSLKAIRLLDADDLSKSKIPRGQKKLILDCVRVLNETNTTRSEAAAPHAPLSGDAQSSSTSMRAPIQDDDETAEMRAHTTNQSAASTSRSTTQDGGAQVTMDAYVQGLLTQFAKGQLQARNGLSSDLQIENSVLSDTGTCSQGVPPAGNVNTTPHTQSWKDPQIYLSSAANGKSASVHYDIVDFVSGNVEEEIIVGGSGSHQVVVKSGPKKPKLENVSLAQWTVANLAILYKLKGDAKLTGEGVFDYLSYTTKVCQLVQRYNLVSVLLYDREYRKLQCSHEFRWGTDVPHLHSVYLQPRVPRQGNGAPKGGNSLRPQSTYSPLTLDGKVICKLFNTKGGCHFKEACRFVHQCSHPGCHLLHSAVTHASKN